MPDTSLVSLSFAIAPGPGLTSSRSYPNKQLARLSPTSGFCISSDVLRPPCHNPGQFVGGRRSGRVNFLLDALLATTDRSQPRLRLRRCARSGRVRRRDAGRNGAPKVLESWAQSFQSKRLDSGRETQPIDDPGSVSLSLQQADAGGRRKMWSGTMQTELARQIDSADQG